MAKKTCQYILIVLLGVLACATGVYLVMAGGAPRDLFVRATDGGYFIITSRDVCKTALSMIIVSLMLFGGVVTALTAIITEEKEEERRSKKY